MHTPISPRILSPADVIEILHLKPLPVEGGYFSVTYRGDTVLPAAFLPGIESDRKITSAIYYFLTAETRSRLHRLPTDEIWHFYLGDPVALHTFQQGGSYGKHELGHNLLAGQQVQVVVDAGTWFGAHLQPGGQWALMGCTLAPEFADEDLVLPSPQEFNALLEQFPAQREILSCLL